MGGKFYTHLTILALERNMGMGLTILAIILKIFRNDDLLIYRQGQFAK